MLMSISVNAQQVAEPVLNKNKFNVIDKTMFDCLYEYKVNTKDKLSQDVVEIYNTILQVGNNSSKFWDYTAFLSDSVSYLNAASSKEMQKEAVFRKLRQKYFFDPIIFQGYPTGVMTVYDVITPNNYTYSQKIDDLNWQLSQDTLRVCGYLCRKATTSLYGRDWIAWYAEEIPSSVGPWKLSGLPGLILQAQDKDQIHSFTAISIRRNALPIYMEQDAQRINVAFEKFLKNKVAFEVDPIKNLPVESIGYMTILKNGGGPDDKTILVNGVQLRIRPNGYIPLELK